MIDDNLVDTHGFTGGYQSVKRFVRKLRGAVSPEARVTSQRPSQMTLGFGPPGSAA